MLKGLPAYEIRAIMFGTNVWCKWCVGKVIKSDVYYCLYRYIQVCLIDMNGCPYYRFFLNSMK